MEDWFYQFQSRHAGRVFGEINWIVHRFEKNKENRALIKVLKWLMKCEDDVQYLELRTDFNGRKWRRGWEEGDCVWVMV